MIGKTIEDYSGFQFYNPQVPDNGKGITVVRPLKVTTMGLLSTNAIPKNVVPSMTKKYLVNPNTQGSHTQVHKKSKPKAWSVTPVSSVVETIPFVEVSKNGSVEHVPEQPIQTAVVVNSPLPNAGNLGHFTDDRPKKTDLEHVVQNVVTVEPVSETDQVQPEGLSTGEKLTIAGLAFSFLNLIID